MMDGYLNRPSPLESWSAYEVTTSFNLVKIRSKTTSSLRLQDSSSLSDYGYQPRQSLSVPQPYSEAPLRPTADACIEEKNAYAAFALGNFYPYDNEQWWSVLAGDSLWSKFLCWEETKPRGDLDQLAHHILDNVQTRATARLMMKQDMSSTRLRKQHMNDSFEPNVANQDDTEVRTDHVLCLFSLYNIVLN